MHIAIDYETYLISEETPWPKPVCLSYKTATGEPQLLVGLDDIEQFLTKHLALKSTFIAHNAAFEWNVTYEHFPKLRSKVLEALLEGRFYCTQIAEQLISHAASVSEGQKYRFGLSDLVLDYFKVDISEAKADPNAWRLRYSELDGVPVVKWPREAVSYALGDALWAYKLWQIQQSEKLRTAHSVASEALLNHMGKYGILVDQDRVATLEQEIKDKLRPSYELLISKGFATVDHKTQKIKKRTLAVRKHVERVVPAKFLRKTAKGAVSTTSEHMHQYQAEVDDPILKAYFEIATYEKVITAFISRLKTGNIIRTRYSATKSTGRTSSSTDKTMPSVNIQQMPREVLNVTWDVRNCFVPRPGYQLVSIDYAGLELASCAHQLGQLYGSSDMLDRINYGDSPTDMHSAFAYQIRNMSGLYAPCTYEEFVSRKKDKTYKEYRQLAKPINLGFPGGIGYDTMRTLLAREGIYPDWHILAEHEREDALKFLAAKLRRRYDNVRIARLDKYRWAIVMDELVYLKKALFRSYPDLQRFLTEDHARFTTSEHRNVRNDYGEWEKEDMYAYDIYDFKRNACTYTAFCNGYLMQTPSAIGAKSMMSAVISKYIDDKRVNPLAFIHDEIVFEVLDTPEKYGIIKEVAEIMIDEMQKTLSTSRITVEASLMNYWMKAGGEHEVTYWKNVGDRRLHEG